MAIFRNYTDKSISHDRSIEDRRRHRQLVEKSIKENLGDILSEESIVGESKNKKFKIPIKGIKEYQFIYGNRIKIIRCLLQTHKSNQGVFYKQTRHVECVAVLQLKKDM